MCVTVCPLSSCHVFWCSGVPEFIRVVCSLISSIEQVSSTVEKSGLPGTSKAYARVQQYSYLISYQYYIMMKKSVRSITQRDVTD